MNTTTQIAAKYAAQWYPYPSAIAGTDSAKKVRDKFASVIASAIDEAACNSHARLTAELAQVSAENKALREALEHAANLLDHVSRHQWGGDFPSALSDVRREARAALAKVTAR